jgi:hypothetical protein
MVSLGNSFGDNPTKIRIMKKLFVILLVGGLLSGCYKEPQSTETIGNGFKVEFLFEKDGIKVYRFMDGGVHYFTSKGETMTTQGSGRSTYEENIQ